MNFLETLLRAYVDLFDKLGFAFAVLYEASYLWLPVVTLIILIRLWMRYIRAWSIQKAGSVLLEIKIPKEIQKSPAAMEIFYSALYQKGAPKNYLETYINGAIPPWFSLELVSIGGDVHFYIWAPSKYKGMIETQLYAQYPEIKVVEVEDYTKEVYVNPDVYTMWGTYFKFTNADAFPIKTYVDYGLDKDPKEEYRIDPMSSVLEYLGSLKKGEQAWIQILIQANKEEGLKEGRLFKKKDWKDAVKAEIKDIQASTTTEAGKFRFLTPGETATLEALERSLGKFAFDTAIRGFYIAKNESFDATKIPGLINTFKQYSFDGLNGFKLGWYTDYEYPWQDVKGMRRRGIERKMLDAYKRRSFFQAPYHYFKQKPIVLTTEELATIYHFPDGIAVQTPTLERIPSKRSGPPPNLPI